MIAPDGKFDVSNFKASPVNYKIALWDPRTNGVRLLKTLIFGLLKRMSDGDLVRINSIRNRSVGRPIEVRDRGIALCLDYAQSYLEVTFIEQACQLSDVEIVEIGGGYGRTCHTMLALHDEIAQYVIVDLPWMIAIAGSYLDRVLTTSQRSKVTFVPLDNFQSLAERQFDLVINIDGFNEFDEGVVMNYLKYIEGHARWFYTKNPVSKYRDAEFDSRTESVETKHAINSGILRDIIDVFDGDAIEAKVPEFLAKFCPGPRWRCVRHGEAEPWSFYHEAIYELQE